MVATDDAKKQDGRCDDDDELDEEETEGVHHADEHSVDRVADGRHEQLDTDGEQADDAVPGHRDQPARRTHCPDDDRSQHRVAGERVGDVDVLDNSHGGQDIVGRL